MPKITPVKWRTLIKLFENYGCQYKRKKGSHHVLTHPESRNQYLGVPQVLSLNIYGYTYEKRRQSKKSVTYFRESIAALEDYTQGIKRMVNNLNR